jgi:hypothetical protein
MAIGYGQVTLAGALHNGSAMLVALTNQDKNSAALSFLLQCANIPCLLSVLLLTHVVASNCVAQPKAQPFVVKIDTLYIGTQKIVIAILSAFAKSNLKADTCVHRLFTLAHSSFTHNSDSGPPH